MENLAYTFDETWDEMHNGEIVAMSPRPSVNHNIISGNIFRVLANYLKGKACIPFADGTDLFLSEDNRFVPDGMIVCNKDIIKHKGVFGTPNLVVEVLSPGSEKKDKGYKKNQYEKYGVSEYWIVDPANLAVEVYLLKDSKFELDDVHAILPDYLTEGLSEVEKIVVPTTFSCSLFPELIISIYDIFDRMI